MEIDPLVIKEKEVEDYLISLCHSCAERKRMRGEISLSENDVENNSSAKRKDKVDQAIGMTNEKCQFGLSRSAVEVLQFFFGRNVVMEKILRVPFIQSVLDDVRLVRSVLTHLPLFSSLLVLNPELGPIIYNDMEFGSIIKRTVDVKYDFSTRMNMVGNYIENKIGHCLKLADEHVCIYVAYYCNE